MAKISLRMYNREIEGLIEQSQRLEEAIAHSRHILQTYPKHLETYRLLGKAYLEARRYDLAVDIFQRVLVAAPDDFVAHVGMSIISDDKGRLDDAIWHMERAFEVQPSNAAIQGELQRLFGRRDGVEPPKIRLTRGALAHMYVQGELYNQAISEIRAVLSADPKRNDMQVLLARAYFRNGQKAEAADICGALLEKYPYCLEANRLMAEIPPTTGRLDVAQEYRQRVIELDPYAAFVAGPALNSESVSDNLVTLERLEYTGEMAEMPPALGIGLESDETVMNRPVTKSLKPETRDLPAWLRETSEGEAAATPATPPPAENDIPEFLRKAGWNASTAAPAREQAAPIEQPAPSEPAAVEGDLPDWVKALAPSEEDTPPSATVPPLDASELTQPEVGQTFAADTPDWLRGLTDEEATQSSDASFQGPASAAPPLPADAPDWLRELGPAPNAQPAAQPSDDTPDWLKQLDGREFDQPAAPLQEETVADAPSALQEEPVAPAQLDDEVESPSVLRDEPVTAAQPESAVASQPEASAPSEPEPERDEIPDWLKEFGNDLETPITPWPEPVQHEAPEPPAVLEPPAIPPPETPVTLGALGTTAKEQDDALAWLESLAAKHGAKPEELVSDPNARTDIAPEWVDKAKELGEQPPEIIQPTPAEAAQAPQPATEEAPTQPVIDALPPVEDETGMWLRSLAQEAAPAEPGDLVQPAASEPEDKLFDFRSEFIEHSELLNTEPEAEDEDTPIMAESETPDWLSALTSTPSERSGLEDAPAWLREPAEEEPEQASEARRATEEVPTQPLPMTPEAMRPGEAPASEETGAELPAWLAGLEKDELDAVPPLPEARPIDELPAWLQAEVEPEPEAKAPANPADWRPIQPLEEAPAEPTPASAELRPQSAEPMSTPEHPAPQPEPVSTEKPPVQAAAYEPAPMVEPALEAPAPAPLQAEQAPELAQQLQPVGIQEPPIAGSVRPKTQAGIPARPAMVSLADAQSQLGRGNIAAALDAYGKLIRKGKSLDDIIRDLRDALYRYPVEVPLWQSLGDAYMRANRLQEALDAYTKAEELLR